MHYLLYVTFNKEHAKTSAEAQQYAESELNNDASFVGEGGRFSSPIADWFSIGGRWSGQLTQDKLDTVKMKKFWDEFEKQQLGWVNNTDKKEADQKKKAEALFMSLFPDFKGVLPIYRDQYDHTIIDDNAQIIDKQVFDSALKEYEGKEEYGYYKKDEWHLIHCDLDDDNIKEEDYVDKKWIVVVDYHS